MSSSKRRAKSNRSDLTLVPQQTKPRKELEPPQPDRGAKPVPRELRYAMLDDPWEVLGPADFQSPTAKDATQQTIVFADALKNGSISADIRIVKSLAVRRDGTPAREATILFRYTGEESYYYAGVGAFGAKFFIGKVIPGDIWLRLGSVGSAEHLREGGLYKLRVECVGSQLALFENGVRVIEVYDEDYAAGQWGLKTWKTAARFSRLALKASQPQCFVVMPFARELEFVHGVIERTVKSYGMQCVRADQLAISRPVIDDIRAQIASADLVIVDFTGKNPNVYYEAGLADAWKKKWIVLAQSTDDLTFDVKHIRTIVYSNQMGADVRLQEQLQKAIQETMGFPALAQPAALPAAPGAKGRGRKRAFVRK